MTEEQQCPFCAIASGNIPSKVLYEDDAVVAFLDINPANAGHTIIIPKKHYAFLYQVPTEEMVKLFAVAKALSVAVVQAGGAQGMNMIYSMGPAAGQRAPHMMIHLIPRFENDKVVISWDSAPASEENLVNMADKIKSTLRSGGVSTPETIEAPKPEPKPSEPEKQDEEEKPKITWVPPKRVP
ncbi:MAG: HIT family protein [Candidatus Nanoarchaeia archaeon]|nr:HIT family protein [Candidatus Nanoarchaeia archaeon]